MRLLLIEDHLRLADYIAAVLVRASFAVDVVHTAGDGIAAAEIGVYDAIVLDLGLPDADGMTVVETLRHKDDVTPIMILTARDGVPERVSALNRGADDYLIKPFADEELVARVRVLLRRPGRALGLSLRLGPLAFDPVTREATLDGAPILLSRRECEALEVLLRRSGRVVPKAAIEESLYAFGDEVASNAVEVVVHRLRKRLEAAGGEVSIKTVRGMGYVLAAGTGRTPPT